MLIIATYGAREWARRRYNPRGIDTRAGGTMMVRRSLEHPFIGTLHGPKDHVNVAYFTELFRE